MTKHKMPEPEIPTLMEVARQLLELQRQQDEWLNIIQSSGLIEIEEPISRNYLLLDLALDILGLPKDNTDETEAFKQANETGVWPEWAFCRDSYYNFFAIMVGKHSDFQGFMDIIQGKRPLPKNWSSDEDLEAFFYSNGGFCE